MRMEHKSLLYNFKLYRSEKTLGDNVIVARSDSSILSQSLNC